MRANRRNSTETGSPKRDAPVASVWIYQVSFPIVHINGSTNRQWILPVNQTDHMWWSFLLERNAPAVVPKHFSFAITSHTINTPIAELLIANKWFARPLGVDVKA